MARPVWTNAAGDFSWATAGNWSTGSVPVNGDDVYFDGNITQASVNEGLAQSAVTLGSLNTLRSYNGEIGSEGTYLEIASTLVRHRGGILHYNCAGVDSARVVMDTDDRRWNRFRGDVIRFNAIKGRAKIAPLFQSSTATASVMAVAYRDNPVADVELELLGSSTVAPAPDYYIQVAGTVRGAMSGAIAYIAGGSYQNDQHLASDVLLIYQYGGRVAWSVAQATDLKIWALGGVFDASKIREFPGIGFVQQCSDLALWPNADVRLPDSIKPASLIDLRHEQEVC